MLKCTVARLSSSPRGFTLVDTMMTVALIGTMAAIAVPAISTAVENQRLGIEARAVERELQLARLSAVSTNRPIRVRFNCPSAGYYRRVELIGSVNDPNIGNDADNQGTVRCGLSQFPYPAADSDPLTRPNNDGPQMRLNTKITFSSIQTLEFWPNGTVHVYSSANGQPWPQIGASPVNLLLAQGSTTRSITVNGLGKTQIQ